MKILVLVATLHDETRTAVFPADPDGFKRSGLATEQLIKAGYSVDHHMINLPPDINGVMTAMSGLDVTTVDRPYTSVDSEG